MSRAPDFSASFRRLQELGLTSDILPVVWNPAVPVSPNSKLRAVGKVPTLINRSGQAVGIAGWTSKQSSAAEVEEWASDPRYGVALQTRCARGLDIDVEDAKLAEAIAATFETALGIKLPRRGRENSGKILLAFRMPSPLKKRVFRCGDEGLIELLADGQQFVFDSIHPSGVPYTWSGGLPDEIPEITLEQLEKAWAAVRSAYLVEPQKAAQLTRKVAPTDASGPTPFTDPRLDWLNDNWPNHGVGSNGYLNIRCPFNEGHSMEGGESECSYLPAGTNGHADGHYKCFHASCEERTRAEFDSATGYDRVFRLRNGSFQWPPEIKRDRFGEVIASLANLTLALGMVELTEGVLAFDEFLGDVFLRPEAGNDAILFDDDMRSELRLRLEKAGFKRINTADLREASRIIGRSNRFDSAQDWLNGLQWDGAPRLEAFFSVYFGVPDTEYARAVSLYLWTALAARVLHPGCQADMVPILVSPEGRHKSRSLQAMAPQFEQFAEIDLQNRDADLSRLMKGKLIGEIAELRGLQQRDAEGIKAFVTKRYEEWTPKYVEKPVRYLRRMLLIGTTNDEEFLGPHTGERRWLPIRIVDGNVTRIASDRDQLWAEAARLVQSRILLGDDPVLWEKAFVLGAAEREAFKVEDSYRSKLAAWFQGTEGKGETAEGFTTDYAMMQIGIRNPGSPYELGRVSRALRCLGFVQKRQRAGERRPRMWFPGEQERLLSQDGGTTGPLDFHRK